MNYKSVILHVFVFHNSHEVHIYKISHRPHWSQLNSQWPNFHFIPLFPSQKKNMHCILQCVQGRVTLFSQNPWKWSYWSGKSKHKLFPNFCIFKHNDNLLIKIYLQPFSLLPHGHMQYKLLLITGWLKDVKANLDCQYSKTAKLSPHLKIEDWDKD